MTREQIDEVWRLLQMAEHVARIYGLGFGEQPTVWPKHEQRIFAEAMASGRYEAARRMLKAAYKEAGTP